MGERTFVGFGFGPIQGGLFLHEAARSGHFRRLVVSEIIPEVVDAVRRAGSRFRVNIAHADRIEAACIGPIEICDPARQADRETLIEAIAQAEELATAVPSVRDYVSPGPGSIHRLLAEGLRRKAARNGPRAVLYAAENHNQAAEILQRAVLGQVPADECAAVSGRVRFLNTVIGKMSRLVSDPAEITEFSLAPITPGQARAFLVEAFNRILISRIGFASAAEEPFRRGIAVFEEKDDLLPFEEAKLYGHNATHALIAYLGALRGIRRIAELRACPELFDFVRAAFLEESGGALIRRHAGVDPLFTPDGYRGYADDLLARMTNPFLQDTVERVGRDPERKLAWDDRLVGTIRIALKAGLTPWRYATGAAAALLQLDPALRDGARSIAEVADRIWRPGAPDPTERAAVVKLIEQARRRLSSQ